MIPSIVNTTKDGRTQTDLYSKRFYHNREIWINDEINDALATEVIMQLKELDETSGDITMIINSPGGSVTAGMAIVDAMLDCENDVVTVCTGMAASMGAVLLAQGTKGKRYITPNAEVMIHQPLLGGARGQASDIEVTANHLLKTKRKINRMLALSTGKPEEEVSRDCDRDYYMDANEAVNYGIVDAIRCKSKF